MIPLVFKILCVACDSSAAVRDEFRNGYLTPKSQLYPGFQAPLWGIAVGRHGACCRWVWSEGADALWGARLEMHQGYGHRTLRLQRGSPDIRIRLPWRQGDSQAQHLVVGWMAGLSLGPGFSPLSPWWDLAWHVAACGSPGTSGATG